MLIVLFKTKYQVSHFFYTTLCIAQKLNWFTLSLFLASFGSQASFRLLNGILFIKYLFGSGKTCP